MHTLACVDVFNLNYPAAASAHTSNGMHAVPAAAIEPRHDCLSHVPSDCYSYSTQRHPICLKAKAEVERQKAHLLRDMVDGSHNPEADGQVVSVILL
jgi:hypothetical protein